VYRYKDAELARLVLPPPLDALAVGAPIVDGGETVNGGTNEDDMTKRERDDRAMQRYEGIKK